MNKSEIDYRPYAALLIEAGINLQKNQNLVIRTDYAGYPLARICAQTAYEHGAGMVEIRWDDDYLLRSRIEAQTGNLEALSACPAWIDAWQKTLVDEKWAYLALKSHENSGLLAGLDQEAYTSYTRAQTDAIRLFRDAVTSHRLPWCVAAAPGNQWAERVLGKGKNQRDLWAVLKPILKLDAADPSSAWKEQAAKLGARAQALNSMRLNALHLEAENTDLTVGLNPASLWMGGAEHFEGRPVLPNIPTEEVFTTPDRMRCRGRAKVTRPVEVRGTIVKGAWLEFSDGYLSDFGADEGEAALAGYVDTDDGSRRLGEVALVGADSPIAVSGLDFGSILLDENAACHIALGSGYSSCMSNSTELDSDEKKQQAGCNVSLVHLDFMIGSPTTSVTGLTADGQRTAIIRNGRFVI